LKGLPLLKMIKKFCFIIWYHINVKVELKSIFFRNCCFIWPNQTYGFVRRNCCNNLNKITWTSQAEIISHRMASLDFTPLFCGDFQSFELERTWWRLLSVPDEGYSRNASSVLKLTSTFLLQVIMILIFKGIESANSVILKQ
jgi:hypothetical protein